MGLKHFYQPTPAVWRKTGDTILLGCTSLSAIMMGAPISEYHKIWAIFGLNIIGVAGKMLTNFFKEDEKKPE